MSGVDAIQRAKEIQSGPRNASSNRFFCLTCRSERRPFDPSVGGPSLTLAGFMETARVRISRRSDRPQRIQLPD
jgi:hypothetical protein